MNQVYLEIRQVYKYSTSHDIDTIESLCGRIWRSSNSEILYGIITLMHCVVCIRFLLLHQGLDH